MTDKTHDPAIEQEAERMLSDIHESAINVIYPDGFARNAVYVSRSELLDLLRELATLRRGAAKPADQSSEIEYCASVPACALSSQQLAELRKWWDAFGAENTPSAILKMVNELLELRCKAATPLSDANLRAIEERAAKATKEPFVRVRYDHGGGRMYTEYVAGVRNLVVDCYEEADREFYFHALADIDTLLAALRSRGGEEEQNKYNMNFAWVIEHAESKPGSPQYFTGKYTPALRWSNDNAEACRFSRKCDAERLARSLDGARNHRIAEHGWSEHNDPAKACENDTMQL